jgi:hypothetical protein
MRPRTKWLIACGASVVLPFATLVTGNLGLVVAAVLVSASLAGMIVLICRPRPPRGDWIGPFLKGLRDDNERGAESTVTATVKS